MLPRRTAPSDYQNYDSQKLLYNYNIAKQLDNTDPNSQNRNSHPLVRKRKSPIRKSSNLGPILNVGHVGHPRLNQSTVNHRCDFVGCSKAFDKISNLTSHLRSHQEVRNYICHLCNWTFRRSHDLKRHQRSIHSEAKPHTCLSCGKSFARQVTIVNIRMH
jgi:hypothetical protein